MIPASARSLVALVYVPCFLFAMACCDSSLDAQIPRGQSKPPNKPYSAEEAANRMTVPDGFTVEVVAAEPDIVNPVAMTFDEQGRIWVTESFEYPRRSAGKGRDRIKVLEDPDGDGKYDKVTIFADDLNIPSGIAVGYGGVWVANAPDLLFMQDTDGDGKCDKRTVVVTGFGRTDTHELPNSLTWGPDGRLYGWNGVFNFSNVKQNGKEFKFTCAIFRINPRNWEFDLFCEGTSNPWGIAINPDGELFASACVIDHLWHLSETGYYHRQGGPYPPHVWKIESIVDYKHQQAAYCGINYFDSDAYPEEYRDKLYMGNIHGNCINVDALERNGSTYKGKKLPDFVTANDAWFMPVVQKTGPDGCLYILDWYDRYHCYQDANRDPEGIDRAKGRLYRVRYKDTPRAKPFNMNKETDEQLVKRLYSKNVFYRDMAQRVLCERQSTASRELLINVAKDPATPYKTRMHALWSLLGMGMESVVNRMEFPEAKGGFYVESDVLRAFDLPAYGLGGRCRFWSARASSLKWSSLIDRSKRNKDFNFDEYKSLKAKIVEIDAAREAKLKDPRKGGILLGVPYDRDYLREMVIGARYRDADAAIHKTVTALSQCGDDVLIPRLAWQSLLPVIALDAEKVVKIITMEEHASTKNVQAIYPRLVRRILDIKDLDPAVLLTLFKAIETDTKASLDASRNTLRILAQQIENGEIKGDRKMQLAKTFLPELKQLYPYRNVPNRFDAAFLALLLGDQSAATDVSEAFRFDASNEYRLRALTTLAKVDEKSFLSSLKSILADKSAANLGLRAQAISAVANSKFESAPKLLIESFASLEESLRPRVIEIATSRASSAKILVQRIAAKKISASLLTANQVRKLFDIKDADLTAMAEAQWGSVRTERDPNREQVINDMRTLLRTTKGDAFAGIKVYEKVCGQCHKIHGQGYDVGPDITANGRNSFEQLLSNVFDPSLVIGASYQARLVGTVDGRSETGLLLENNVLRVVLNTQGGKKVTIPRDDIEAIKVSKLSLMPEGLEQNLKRQEIADLFAFITLDKHPSDPLAKPIPGALDATPRKSTNAKDFPELAGSVLYGFSTKASGLDGMAIEADHLGKNSVLRIHPLSEKQPAVLTRTIQLPVDKKLALRLSVSHFKTKKYVGDWKLVVKVNGKKLQEKNVGASTAANGWADLEFDMSAFAGKEAKIELECHATGWYYEFAYFHKAEIISK